MMEIKLMCIEESKVRKGVMLNRCKVLVSALLIVCFSELVGAVTLQDVHFSTLAGDKTSIRFDFDGVPPSPAGYTIEQPARIALDMKGVKNGLSKKRHSLGVGNTRSVMVVESDNRTRVIVNLVELVPYSSRIDGNSLYVVVGDAVNANQAPMSKPSVSSVDVVSQNAVASIANVDFRRGDDGGGQVLIELSDPSIQVNLYEEGKTIKAEFAKTVLPESLLRRLDVKDFATPVQVIDTLNDSEKTTIVIEADGQYDYLAYQADNLFTINVKPLTGNEIDLKRAAFLYTGEKLSLNFQDIEVRSVLQLIADFTGNNLVTSDAVEGRITLRLQNVPWDQALDLILKTKGLGKRKVGNVMMVAPAAEIAAREKLELETNQQVAELAPLQTEYISIRYADAEELAGLFSSGGEEGAGILSERGSAIVDPRTNTILLTETAEKVEEIRRVINALDVPIRQVMIEARIVVANTDFSEALGVRWGGSKEKDWRNNNTAYFGASADNISSTGVTDALVVDLGVTGAPSSFAIGFSDGTDFIEAELSALESDGLGEIISQPKLITSDQTAARIEVGTEIPYLEASSSGAATVSFKDAVLSLEVTPNITPDDQVILQVQVNKDDVGEIFAGVPSIDTTEIQTEVLIANGETVVLGGVYEDSVSQTISKTPLLGDIPYLGRFFRNESSEISKQEVLIFITPRIIKDTLTVR